MCLVIIEWPPFIYEALQMFFLGFEGWILKSNCELGKSMSGTKQSGNYERLNIPQDPKKYCMGS